MADLNAPGYGRVVDYFSDCLMEAESYIQQGLMTPEEVVDAMVQSIVDWETFYTENAKIYAQIRDALARRVAG